MYYAYSNDQMS